jgi:hyperosmotically inducible protein
MISTPLRLERFLVPLGGVVLSASLMAIPAPRPQDSQQTSPDNTQQNKDQTAPTADKQGMNPSDRAITQKIRKAIQEDKSLSTYAHNVKVITRGGTVTLRGPVRSEDEKATVQAKAVAVVGEASVVNDIAVAPSK